MNLVSGYDAVASARLWRYYKLELLESGMALGEARLAAISQYLSDEDPVNVSEVKAELHKSGRSREQVRVTATSNLDCFGYQTGQRYHGKTENSCSLPFTEWWLFGLWS